MSRLLPDDINLALRMLLHFSILSFRYLLFAGGAYLLYYVIKRQEWFFMKIQQKYPKNKQVATEIKYSLLTFLMFTGFGLTAYLLTKNFDIGTNLYSKFSEHSILYYIFSIVFMIFAHDTYFYWTHRLMHHPKIYKYVHRTHHLSTDPTPWAVFAFHPLEAFIDGGIVAIVFFTIPVHVSAIIIFSTWFIVMNVIGHLGYEIFPRKMLQHPIFKYMNNPTNHNMHHQYIKCNYSLYFTFWDSLMKTNHERYYEHYDEVTRRRDEGLQKLKEEKQLAVNG
jgi:lathosterol oxidase